MRALLLGVGMMLATGVAQAQKLELDKILEKKAFKGSDGKSLNYRFLAPEKVESGKTYPLVIFLHGAGERGDDNTKQMVHGVADFVKPESRAKYPCFLIAPQCPTGKRWAEVDWSAAKHDMPPEPGETMALLLGLIDSLVKDLPIDKKRIYVTGLSMGGYGTWDILARRPDFFAAGMPICGGADEKTAPRIVKIPVWVFHGDKDTAVKVERSRNMVEALKKAGGMPKYTEYPGVGHNSWTQTYANPEVLQWLFGQKRE